MIIYLCDDAGEVIVYWMGCPSLIRFIKPHIEISRFWNNFELGTEIREEKLNSLKSKDKTSKKSLHCFVPNLYGNWIAIGKAECQGKVLHDAGYMFYCKTIKLQFIWKLHLGYQTLIPWSSLLLTHAMHPITLWL